jgi:hypothetical protein
MSGQWQHSLELIRDYVDVDLVEVSIGVLNLEISWLEVCSQLALHVFQDSKEAEWLSVYGFEYKLSLNDVHYFYIIINETLKKGHFLPITENHDHPLADLLYGCNQRPADPVDLLHEHVLPDEVGIWTGIPFAYRHPTES